MAGPSGTLPADDLPVRAPFYGGGVSLKDKARPTCEQHAEGALSESALPLVFTRAENVDVGPIKSLLTGESGQRYWSEEEHGKSNVQLVRPAHDRWGIKKAVFVFCDDNLEQVYRFPWWNDTAWQEALRPVFESIQVDPHRVCRCLLASMPPGCVIPVHHDTGHWVQHTHRVHVPIMTDSAKVCFQVGVDEENMQRILFEEGSVIELNNQGKHAVTNGWDQFRVHLIFDYVDAYPLAIKQLSPGERLFQTRRTILAESDLPAPKFPAFIILGAQKSGTTSLYEYINQHPLVVRANRRETHFFDWRWPAHLEQPEDQLAFYKKFFDMARLSERASLATGESSPSYLLHSDLVIPRLKALCPDTPLIVTLRDPVKRAYSHFHMATDPNGTMAQKKIRGQSVWKDMTFEEVVSLELSELQAAGITAGSSAQAFSAKVLKGLPMHHGGHSLLARGLYALQLEPWLAAFPREQVKVVFLEDMSGPLAVQQTVQEVFTHIGCLPPARIRDATASNTRGYPPMRPETADKLRAFYEPHNERLMELLQRTGGHPWREGDKTAPQGQGASVDM